MSTISVHMQPGSDHFKWFNKALSVAEDHIRLASDGLVVLVVEHDEGGAVLLGGGDRRLACSAG
jgi:hypothetical protein